MLLPKQKKKNPFSKLLNFFNDPSVGEPAEGSLLICLIAPHVFFFETNLLWRWAQPAARGLNLQPIFYQLVTPDYY